MLRTLAGFSQRRIDIRTQLNARRQATPFVFRIGLAVSLLVLSGAATPTRTTAQTGQPPANAASLAQNENDVRVLELGKPIERKLTRGEVHSYRVALALNQFLHAVVEQKDIDVVVTLHDPDGNKLEELDNPFGTQAPELISIVAVVAGSYRLDVRPLEKDAAAGNYEIKVIELRDTTAQDRIRIAAKKATRQAKHLGAQRTAESQRKALEKYKEALSLWRAVGDRDEEAKTLSGIGIAYVSIDEYQQALDHLNQALTIQRTIGDREGQAHTLSTLSVVYLKLGNFQKGSDLKAQANQLLATTLSANTVTPQNALALAGQVVNELNYLLIEGTEDARRKALKKAEEVLQFRESLGSGLVIIISIQASQVYTAIGEKQKALAILEQALSLSRAEGHHDGQAMILEPLGNYYLIGGDKLKAIDYYNQAIENWRLAGDRLPEAVSLNFAAQIYLDLGEREKALNYLHRSLTIFRESGVSDSEAQVLNRLMLTWKTLNKPRPAIFYGKQAVNTIQRIRANIQGFDKETKRRFIDFRKHNYRELADLLISEGRLPEAQQVLGLLKEEEYFEFVRRDSKEGLALTKRADLTPEEAEWDKRYREIAEQVTAIGRERGELLTKKSRIPAEEERLKELEAKLQVVSRAFQQFLDKLAEELAGAKQGSEKVFQLRESQGLMEDLRELGAGAVALYTVVGEEKYRVILVTPDVQKAYEYPIKAADLYRKVFAFREVLEDPKRDPLPLARELYGILVGPLAKDLQGARAETLMWSLDSVLRYIPVAALHDGERYMVERYRNVIFTPASNSRLKDAPSAGWKGLGLGVSKAKEGFSALPAVAEELDVIIREESANGDDAGVMPGRVMLDEAFTGEAMRAGLRQRYPVVHIASHFQFNPGNETNSFLLLGDGSRMSLAEIKTLPNVFGGVELLTLSACNTAMSGAGADGKEVEGFAVMAQRQGAKAVIASLWPVADRSTRMLMQDFYLRRGAQAGIAKAEALRQAQVALLRGGEKGSRAGEESRGIGVNLGGKASRAHPYYWAPFILIGNWR